MDNQITLRQFVGRVIGSGDPNNVVRYPMDEIVCNGRRIGFIDHKPNSTIRFVRILSEPTRKEIHGKVAALRKQFGGPPISELTAQPPNPDNIRAYLEKLKGQQGVVATKDDDDE